jgi:putative NIF3 family GTP cyclohydrolase 1 type 2
MKTNEMMSLALELADLSEIPYDSTISVSGENITKVLIGVDMETQELLLAKELGVDCVVSHHPKADTARTDFSKVMKKHEI